MSRAQQPRSRLPRYGGRGRVQKVVDKKTGRTVFQGEWRDERGRRHRRVLASDRRVAEQMLDRLVADRERRGAGAAADLAIDVAELIRRYVEDRSAGWRPSTVLSIAHVAAQVSKAFAGVLVGDLTLARVLDYVALRRRGGVSNRTVNIDTGLLRSSLRWGMRRELLSFDPLASFERLPEGPAHEKRPRREFSTDEVRRFLSAAAALDVERAAHHAAERTIAAGTKGQPYAATVRPLRIPQQPMWRTLLFTGIRWGEMAAVTRSDVDLEAKTLRLRATTTKSKRPRTIPLAEPVVAALRALDERRRAAFGRLPEPGDFVFLTPLGEPWHGHRNNGLRLFHETLQRAGIEKRDVHGRSATIHGLRHSFITMLARAKVPLIEAQHLAGHSDPRLTAARYTHLHAEDLRSAVDKLPRFDCDVDGASEKGPGYRGAPFSLPTRARSGRRAM